MIRLSTRADPALRAAVSLLMRSDRSGRGQQTALIVLNARDRQDAPAGSAESNLSRCVEGALAGGIPVHHTEPATLSALAQPELRGRLDEQGVERVVLVGSSTDLQVDSTARHAAELDLHVTVVADACWTRSPGAHRTVVRVTLPRICHQLLDTDQFLALVGAASPTK